MRESQSWYDWIHIPMHQFPVHWLGHWSFCPSTGSYMYIPVHPVGIVRSGFFSNTMYKWLTCTFMWLGGVWLDLHVPPLVVLYEQGRLGKCGNSSSCYLLFIQLWMWGLIKLYSKVNGVKFKICGVVWLLHVHRQDQKPQTILFVLQHKYSHILTTSNNGTYLVLFWTELTVKSVVPC